MSVDIAEPLESPASRDVILSAAETLMAEIGYDKTSVAKICRASGLPVGSIYHHFGSKAGVLSAILERGSQRFLEEMPQTHELRGTPEQNMHTYWSAAADVMVAHSPYFIIECDLVRFDRDNPDIAPGITAATARTEIVLRQVIEPFARQVGAANPSDLAGRLVRFTLVHTRGALIEAGRDRQRLRDMIEEQYAVLRAAILQAGVAARPEPPVTP